MIPHPFELSPGDCEISDEALEIRRELDAQPWSGKRPDRTRSITVPLPRTPGGWDALDDLVMSVPGDCILEPDDGCAVIVEVEPL